MSVKFYSMKNIAYYTIALLCLFGCGMSGERAVLNDVGTYINERPDSALCVLNTIDCSNISAGRTKAEYAILKSIALDKCYVDVKEDSLTAAAVGWYSKHGSPRDKMLAYYYQGRVCQNAGEHISAIIAYSQAEKYALQAEEWLYLGLIYRGIAEIHSDNYNLADQLKYAILAKDCFEKSGSQAHYGYSLLDIATANHNLKNFETAKEQCLEIKAIAENNKDTELLKGALELYASSILFQNEPEPETYIKIASYLIDSLQYEPSIHIWNKIALAYSLTGQYGTASDIISQLKPLAKNNDINKASISITEYQIEKAQRRYRQALEKFEVAVNIQDSLSYSILNQSVLSAQKDYFKQQSEYDTYRLKVRSLTTMTIVILAALIVCVIGILSYRRIRSKDTEIEDYINQVSDMVELMSRLSDTIRHENKETISEFKIQIGNLYRLKFNFLDEICRQYYSYSHTRVKQRQIFATVEAKISELTDDMEFKALESIVDSFKNGVMNKLRMEFPQFREEDFKMMCYWYAGFSSASMSLLLKEENMNIIYKRKSRLKDRIEKSDSPRKDFFIEELYK